MCIIAAAIFLLLDGGKGGDPIPMVTLLSHAAASGEGGALNCSSTHCLNSAHPIPPLVSKRRCRRPNFSISRHRLKPLSVSNTADTFSTVPFHDDRSVSIYISISSFGVVPRGIEGHIQFENLDSTTSFLATWGRVLVLAAGDVAALLLFSAIGRLIHGFSVFHVHTFNIADPFIAGWFLSAYFLGGYGEEGRGINGLWRAVTAATKSLSFGIPLGLIVRSVTIGHTPSFNFIFVTIGSTAILLIGWRVLLFNILCSNQRKKNDVLSPFFDHLSCLHHW